MVTDQKNNKQNNWTPFYFDGNQARRTIESREEWENFVLKNYSRINQNEARLLDRSLKNENSEGTIESFGLSGVYNSQKTLRDFFKENNIVPSSEITTQPAASKLVV